MARVVRSVREQVKKWALWPAVADPDIATHFLVAVKDPTLNQHGATKKYVDDTAPAVIAKGSSTFNGETGQIITHNYGSTAYLFIITATVDPAGYLGEVWVVKANDTATVYNGTATGGAFDYIILKL